MKTPIDTRGRTPRFAAWLLSLSVLLLLLCSLLAAEPPAVRFQFNAPCACATV